MIEEGELGPATSFKGTRPSPRRLKGFIP
jgi:hypothetical protein